MLWRRLTPLRVLLLLGASVVRTVLLDAGGGTAVTIVHVGKTGGTTLWHALAPRLDWDRVEWLQHTAALHQGALNCSHEHIGLLVFFVRHPVRRYASGWLSRFREGRPTYVSPHSPEEALAFTRFRSPEELARALGSPSAATAELARWAMRSIQHVGHPLSAYLGGVGNLRRCQILFVGRTENLAGDTRRLAAKLRARSLYSGPLPNLSAGAAWHAMPTRYQSLAILGDGARGNLNRWYREDYDIIDELKHRGLLPAAYLLG